MNVNCVTRMMSVAVHVNCFTRMIFIAVHVNCFTRMMFIAVDLKDVLLTFKSLSKSPQFQRQ